MVAVALIFVGVLLGAAVPQLHETGQDLVGEGSSLTGGAIENLPADIDLQKEILKKLGETYYKEVDPEALAVGAIDGMLASLGDPYTVYYDAEEYADLIQETSGSYGGVGMVLQMDGRLPTVVGVFDDTPASEALIEAGDIIVSVDGVSTSGRTLDDVVSDIKGAEGTKVELEMYRPATATTTTTTVSEAEGGTSGEDSTTVTTEAAKVDLTELPAGGSSKQYTLTRRSIVIPTTETETLDAGNKKVAYIILYTFNNENAAQQLRREVDAALAGNADAVILDLRGNGGGLLDEAIKVASIFIENGVIVSTKGLHYPEVTQNAVGDAVADVPLYVLTDKFSASASEIVAGALQDYGRATLVGDTTYGKGLVQQIESLSNGGAIKVTIEVYLTPKGRDINAKGITPDVVAPDDPATDDVDETLQKTLDLITSGSAGR